MGSVGCMHLEQCASFISYHLVSEEEKKTSQGGSIVNRLTSEIHDIAQFVVRKAIIYCLKVFFFFLSLKLHIHLGHKLV